MQELFRSADLCSVDVGQVINGVSNIDDTC